MVLSFPESCHIRGIRLAMEQTFRADLRHLKLQIGRQNAFLFPEEQKLKAFFREGSGWFTGLFVTRPAPASNIAQEVVLKRCP